MTTAPLGSGPTSRSALARSTSPSPASPPTSLRAASGKPIGAFAAALGRAIPRDLGQAASPAPPPTKRSPVAAQDGSRLVEAKPERAARGALEREPDSDLAPFRPLPVVLTPLAAPPAPSHTPPPRGEVARLAELLVTRLRVGRSREGAVVELRLSLEGRGELDVRLVEAADGVTLHVEGADPGLERALHRELARRGVSLVAR